ncbi:MAG: hypothetical protein LBU27_09830 [Candidatus Peribacteria bacterium]|jgi:hypothetical protein|nr:hypothetical protein [Candidatus Peribacteria bacterium]
MKAKFQLRIVEVELSNEERERRRNGYSCNGFIIQYSNSWGLFWRTILEKKSANSLELVRIVYDSVYEEDLLPFNSLEKVQDYHQRLEEQVKKQKQWRHERDVANAKLYWEMAEAERLASEKAQREEKLRRKELIRKALEK